VPVLIRDVKATAALSVLAARDDTESDHRRQEGQVGTTVSYCEATVDGVSLPPPAGSGRIAPKGVASVAVLDTGAAISVMSSDIFRQVQESRAKDRLPPLALDTAEARRLQAFSGHIVRARGTTTVRVMIGGRALPTKVYVLDNAPFPLLLGVNFMLGRGVIIDFRKGEVVIGASDNPDDVVRTPIYAAKKTLVEDGFRKPAVLVAATDMTMPPRCHMRVPMCVHKRNEYMPPDGIYFLEMVAPLNPERANSVIPLRGIAQVEGGKTWGYVMNHTSSAIHLRWTHYSRRPERGESGRL